MRFAELVKKIPDPVVGTAGCSGIKACNDREILCFWFRSGIQQNFALGADNPDVTVAVRGQSAQIFIQLVVSFLIILEIPHIMTLGNGGSFLIQFPAVHGFQMFLHLTVSHKINGAEAQQSQNDNGKHIFYIEKFFHLFLTSNLYPIPQTVAMDQAGWSLIFSRRRLICTSTVRVSPMYSYPQIWSKSCSLVKT